MTARLSLQQVSPRSASTPLLRVGYSYGIYAVQCISMHDCMQQRNDMDLAKLRHIVAIAEARSFSRAAERQNITQPALSRSIAGFEARHGVRLFDRGRGGVMPTPAGDFVVEQARNLLNAADELERNLRLYEQGAAGRVAFGLGPLMASLVLPKLSQTLLQSRPKLQIVTMVKPAEQLLGELLNGNIEMILGNSWLVRETPGVISDRLGRLDLGVIVRGDHPLTRRPRLNASDLEEFPIARPIRPASDAQVAAGAFICDNFHILREAVLNTDCVWISSPAFVAEELRDGRLTLLAIKGLHLPENEICVISRPGRTRSPAAEAIIEMVRLLLNALPKLAPD